MSVRALALGTLCWVPVAGWCEDAAAPPPQQEWTGKGQAGYTSSSGNSEGKSANAGLDAAYVDGPWKHALHLGGLYGQSAGIVSAERWDTGWQSNYDLTAALYVFGGLRFQHDLYSGFLTQESLTGGVGYKVYDSATRQLDVQVGAGYKRLRPEELTKNDAGEVISRQLQPTESGAIGTVGVNYSQALTGTTTLTDKLLVESGAADTLVTNALAVAVKISTKLAVSVGYTIQDNTKPPAGAVKMDRLATLNLVYAF